VVHKFACAGCNARYVGPDFCPDFCPDLSISDRLIFVSYKIKVDFVLALVWVLANH